LRAKIALWHLEDDSLAEIEKWTNKARLYLQYAAAFSATAAAR
jgi:hypothetical protein